jgi:hypothetical protein
MPTFETLPRFEKDWTVLTPQQRSTFRKVIKEAFVPDLIAPDRPFRPGLRVKGVQAHANVFEMTWATMAAPPSAMGPNACLGSRTSSGGASEPTTSSLRRLAHNVLALASRPAGPSIHRGVRGR